jgi:hypothetical protein
MAYTFQQQSTIRKFVYFALILGLFTVSLVHRKMVINAQANELQMRESARGKADLTDSALRLTLSGVRGVAVTSLWLATIEHQKRHEWTEMEVLVDSLTRLQPRFISPWLFQGWNLAFNVAVECDRPRDKYYYITRGITLLCRGEEKNDPGQAVPPQPWPASPEMRFQVGFTYQLKIGQGDENKTQRCLYEMSCIPFIDRDPDKFWIYKGATKVFNLAKFQEFCRDHPRLVRRLNERLTGFSYPEDIVGFLNDNKDVPGRMEDRSKLDENDRLNEFPVLPPPNAKIPSLQHYPDWHNASLSTPEEDFDVYICTRAWYAYAQLPLPPESTDPDNDMKPFDRLQYRTPKMSTVIFRNYPARAEAYYAENLQLDGWFDEDGWLVRDWFDKLLSQEQQLRVGGFVVGEGDRFHSGKAWGRSYDLYLDYGKKNGLYLDPKTREALIKAARQLGPNSKEARTLVGNESIRSLTNFDALFRQTEVERTAEAVAARKAIYEAKRIRSSGDYRSAMYSYQDRAMPLWLDLLLRYPEFRAISTIQEETYELEADYFEMVQRYRKPTLEALVRASPMFAPLLPQPGFVVPLAEPSGKAAEIWPQMVLDLTNKHKKIKVFPIRDVEGPLDQLFVLEPPDETGAKALEALKPLAEAMARQALWPPPPEKGRPDFAFGRFVVWPPPKDGTPEIGLGSKAVWPPPKWLPPTELAIATGSAAAVGQPQPLFLLLSSAEQRRILTTTASHRHPPAGQGWTPLIPLNVIEQSRERVPWMRLQKQLVSQ